MTFGRDAAWQAWLLLEGRASSRAAVPAQAPATANGALVAPDLAARPRRAARAHLMGTDPPRRVARPDDRERARACVRGHATCPRSSVSSAARGRMLIVLDSSWSMLTRPEAADHGVDQAAPRRARLPRAPASRPRSRRLRMASFRDRRSTRRSSKPRWMAPPRRRGPDCLAASCGNRYRPFHPPRCGSAPPSSRRRDPLRLEAAPNVGVTAFDGPPLADAGKCGRGLPRSGELRRHPADRLPHR